MSKIELFVLKEDLSCAIEVLHRLGLLHIEHIPLTKIMEQRGIGRAALTLEEEKEKTFCEELIKEVNGLIGGLRPFIGSSIGQEQKEGLETNTIPKLSEIIRNQLCVRLNTINKDEARLKSEFEILPRYKEIFESFKLSKTELKIPGYLACLALIFDRRYEKDMMIFKKHLENKTDSALEVYTAPLGPKKIVALLFYPPEIVKQIDEEIFKKGTIKVELPSRFLSQPLEETIRSIEERLKHLPGEIEALKKTLSEFARENISLIGSIKSILIDRLEEKRVLNNILQTSYTSLITGWLPTRDMGGLNKSLEEVLGKNFTIYDRTPFVKHREQIPVLLENPKVIRPYELLLSLLPLPKYGTRDATSLVSLFFPLFFGLIVGDIGYGLIFLALSLFFKKSAKGFIRAIGSILFAASISSIFFGVLYGEFFGNLGKEVFGLPHLLFDRHESIIPFLILALSVGVFHIALGFLLGILEALRKRHKKELIEKVSILGGLAGLFLLVGSLVKVLPSGFLPPSIALLVVVSILLIIVKGFIGPLEAISAVANILSYARLMALGLAGVMMASVANHIGGLPENVIIGIILASLLHALNLVLSVFSPTVQSLRLHYVEFFSKFYEPGGKKYSPFKKKEVLECIS